MQPSQREEVKRIWECEEGTFPDVYLGLPLGSSYKRVAVWQFLIDRFRSRLAHWKKRYLTKAGRLVLIKSTLAAIPVYMLSLFRIPRTVALEIESIMKDFLWGSKANKRKIHCVSWEEVCLPFELGGLGLRRVEDINESLLSKWLWEIGEAEEKMWKRLMRQKYGESVSKWCTAKPAGPIGLSPWRSIMLGVESFNSRVKYVLGSGKRIRFWFDWWIGQGPLYSVFPKVFSLTRKINGMVADFSRQEGQSLGWNLHMKRRLKDDEIGEAAILVDLLQRAVLSEVDDSRGWLMEEKVFKVNTCSNQLGKERRIREQRGLVVFPIEYVWKKETPPKVNFTMWLVMKDRIQTSKNLQRRGMQLVSRCPFCCNAEEDTVHLFFQCCEVQELWRELYADMGLVWPAVVMPMNVITTERPEHLSLAGEAYWNLLYHAVVWTWWLERNRRTFEEDSLETWKLVNRVKETMWEWGLGQQATRGITKEGLIFNLKNHVSTL